MNAQETQRIVEETLALAVPATAVGVGDFHDDDRVVTQSANPFHVLRDLIGRTCIGPYKDGRCIVEVGDLGTDGHCPCHGTGYVLNDLMRAILRRTETEQGEAHMTAEVQTWCDKLLWAYEDETKQIVRRRDGKGPLEVVGKGDTAIEAWDAAVKAAQGKR